MNFRIIILIFIFYNSLLTAQHQTKDSTSAYNYYLAGHEYKKIYQYDSAAYYFDMSADLYEGQKMWVKSVRSLNQSIKMKYKDQKIDDAFQSVDKAFSIANKYFSNTNALELNEMVNLIRYKGVLYKNLSDHENTLFYFNKSLEYNLMLKEYDSLNYLINESKLLFGIGIVYLIDRKKDPAISYFNNSLQIQKSLPFDQDFNLSIIYLNIGSVYLFYMDYETASKYYFKAKATNIPLYNNFDLIDSYANNQIGSLLFAQGKYGEALEYYKNSLLTKKKLFGEKHVIVADGNSTVALAYLKNGNFDEAIHHVNSGLSIYLELFGEKSTEVSDAYIKLAELYSSKRQYSETLHYLNLALEIQLDLVGENHFSISKIYNKLGDAYVNLLNLENALSFYQLAIISNVLEFEKQNVHTNPLLTDQILSRPDLLNTLQKKAEIFHELYLVNNYDTANIFSAYKTFKLSFQLADMIRQDHRSEEAKMIMSEKIRPVFNNAIDITYEINESISNEYKTKIFEFMEEARSSALYSMMNEFDASLYSGSPERFLEKDKKLKIDLTYFETQIKKIKQQNDLYDTALVKLYEQRYFELFVQRDSLLNEIAENYPNYNERKTTTDLITVEELQLNLDDNTALLEYFTGDTNMYISVITGELIHIEKVKINDLLRKQTLKYYKNIRKWGNKRSIVNLSHELYNILIKPIEEIIEGKEKLIIIPDEYLFYLPFETLCSTPISDETEIRFSELSYMVRDFEISYHYSASLWVKSKKKSEQFKTLNNLGSFCAFAPVFSEDNAGFSKSLPFLSESSEYNIWRSITIDGKHFNTLPHTEKEVDTLTTLFKAKGLIAESFLHAKANEYNFKKNIKDYKYIHVATHGFSNDKDPNLSGLVFSPETTIISAGSDYGDKSTSFALNNNNRLDDGILYSAEMYNLNLNANLVVLSACETGIGKLRTGEGLMAMTRGLVYAGVPNIIFTLWKVSDSHTHKLMVKLYSEILNGTSYSRSLQKAKLEMINNETTAFPGLWSGFLLCGQ